MALARLACTGQADAYREVSALLFWRFSATPAGSAEPIPRALALMASEFKDPHTRADFRHRLLALAAEMEPGRAAAERLAQLLPAIANMCRDFRPTHDMDSSLVKHFRSLWYSIALAWHILRVTPSEAAGKHAPSFSWPADWASSLLPIALASPSLMGTQSGGLWRWSESDLGLSTHKEKSRWKGRKHRATSEDCELLAAALGGSISTSTAASLSSAKANFLLAASLLEALRIEHTYGLLESKDGNKDRKQESALCFAFSYFLVLSRNSLRNAARLSAGRPLQDMLLKQHLPCRPFPTAFKVLWEAQCWDCMVNLLAKSAKDPDASVAVRKSCQGLVSDWVTRALDLAPYSTLSLLQEHLSRATDVWAGGSLGSSELLSLLPRLQLTWTFHTLPVAGLTMPASAGSTWGPNSVSLKSMLAASLLSGTIKNQHRGEVAGMARLLPLLGNSTTSLCKRLQDSLTQQVPHLAQRAKQGKRLDISLFRDACLRLSALIASDGVSLSLQLCFPANLVLPSIIVRYLPLTHSLRLSWTGPRWQEQSVPCAGHQPKYLRLRLWRLAFRLGRGFLPHDLHWAPEIAAESAQALLWTQRASLGIFCCSPAACGPHAALRPQLAPGFPDTPPLRDPVEEFDVHHLWLSYIIDRLQVASGTPSEEVATIERMVHVALQRPECLTRHPAASGAIFTFLQLALRLATTSPVLSPLQDLLLEKVCRAGLEYLSDVPTWYEWPEHGRSALEIQPLLDFMKLLPSAKYLQGSSNRKGSPRAAEKCISIEPAMAGVGGHSLECGSQAGLSLPVRFPTVGAVRARVEKHVQATPSLVRHLAAAVPYLVTEEAVRQDAGQLQHLAWWAPCSIAQALGLLAPPLCGHPRVMAYALRVLQSYPPDSVTFFMPQLIQALRHDQQGLLEGYLMVAAQSSDLFAHLLIWQLQGEEAPPAATREASKLQNNRLWEIVPRVRQRILDSLKPASLNHFEREFRYFDKVTSISGILKPVAKPDRRARIQEELEKLEVEGDDLYLPTAPELKVLKAVPEGSTPLQSAAKVPILVNFECELGTREGQDGATEATGMEATASGSNKNGKHMGDKVRQGCIFKVGDDCRQDVLALQVITLLRNIFRAVHLNLYLFPYGVLPTGYERGIIELVPDTRSRAQIAEVTDGGLCEVWETEYGLPGSTTYEEARTAFLVSSAGYAVASLLLQPKDRHNGNLLFDKVGHIVHIDFGFILETSPGGNMRFESADFKLSYEMTQLLDPSGDRKSSSWLKFVSLAVKGYLAAREHMEAVCVVVGGMEESGLPCFGRGDPMGNLRRRFHMELNDREAAAFMRQTCVEAYNKWTTAGYDLIQYLQQGIER
eukprot:SM000152S01568  [mRNA]  locus=s152:325750:333245:- [translate_table: standard]